MENEMQSELEANIKYQNKLPANQSNISIFWSNLFSDLFPSNHHVQVASHINTPHSMDIKWPLFDTLECPIWLHFANEQLHWKQS